MMLVKRIMGFIMLGVFISFMGYKFLDTLGGNKDAAPTIALVVVVVLILIVFILKILRDD